MEKWKLKAVVQKVISFLPYPEKTNYFFQKYVTKAVHLTDDHFEYKVQHAYDHIQYFRQYSQVDHNGIKILELGTGWYPIIPIFMYLTKTGSVSSIDIQDWMTKDRFIETIEKVKCWKEEGKIKELYDLVDEGRWKTLIAVLNQAENYALNELKELIQMHTFLMDARHTDFEDASFDFICSNNTFEHIYFDVLSDILREFKRLIKPNGVMSHFIDLSDHFAHFDHKINIYNFLRYSEQQWKLIDNSIQPQNRKRWKHYQDLYDHIGITRTEEKIRKGDIKLLETVPVHSSFHVLSKEELAISHGYIVSVC